MWSKWLLCISFQSTVNCEAPRRRSRRLRLNTRHLQDIRGPSALSVNPLRVRRALCAALVALKPPALGFKPSHKPQSFATNSMARHHKI